MTTTANTRTGLDRFLEATSNSTFRRSDNKVIAGVCGAVAQRLGVAPKVVRIATVVLAFVTPMLAIYLLAWVLLPDSRGRTVIQRALRGGETKAIALSVIAALAILSDIGVRAEIFWPMLVVGAIVAGIALSARRRRSLPAAASGQPTAYGQQAPYGAPTAYGPQQPYGAPTPQDAPRW